MLTGIPITMSADKEAVLHWIAASQRGSVALPQRIDVLIQEMEWLIIELQACRSALKYYGDPAISSADAGMRAREALTGIDPATKVPH